MMKTYMAKAETADQKWYVADASGKVLGRFASEIASRLRGKHKPTYTPHVDTGDFIIVVNAEKVVLTAKKLTDKKYYSYSGYPGGIKETTAGKMLAEKPEEVIRIAVQGMLPKTNLGRKMLKKLKVYSGSAHIHEAQCPETLSI
ncbi:MAG: 50S ribosomal protein L13 [Smithella sp.]|nr:50S ribosomal protein L13 [Smithella sp.]